MISSYSYYPTPRTEVLLFADTGNEAMPGAASFNDNLMYVECAFKDYRIRDFCDEIVRFVAQCCASQKVTTRGLSASWREPLRKLVAPIGGLLLSANSPASYVKSVNNSPRRVCRGSCGMISARPKHMRTRKTTACVWNPVRVRILVVDFGLF